MDLGRQAGRASSLELSLDEAIRIPWALRLSPSEAVGLSFALSRGLLGGRRRGRRRGHGPILSNFGVAELIYPGNRTAVDRAGFDDLPGLGSDSGFLEVIAGLGAGVSAGIIGEGAVGHGMVEIEMGGRDPSVHQMSLFGWTIFPDPVTICPVGRGGGGGISDFGFEGSVTHRLGTSG